VQQDGSGGMYPTNKTLVPPDRRAMLALPSHAVMAQTNPLTATCGDARTLFKDHACCSATLTKEIDPMVGFCPTLDELITYPVQKGVVRTPPAAARSSCKHTSLT